jgi:hypothetical protein
VSSGHDFQTKLDEHAHFRCAGTMCHVVMNEAGTGKDAAGLRMSDETLMDRGHDLWLATLKWVAEAK